jgi:NAD(P)-dependent dehydrogenase (short-subunit alcohol dehydrogenase family)
VIYASNNFIKKLNNDSTGHSNIFPLKMDVTKEDEVKNAAVVVNKWINENTTAELTTSPRLLHAVVNNAGIGSGGLIDWLDISVFRKDMEGE